MTNNVKKAVEQFRTETRTAESIEMEYVNYSLMKKIKQTVGKPNSRNQSRYSIERLVEYFQCEDDPSNYIKWEGEDERQELYNLFKDIYERLQFIKLLHHNVKHIFKERLDSEQLSCIFHAFNDVIPNYEDSRDSTPLASLIDYIDHEGKSKFRLGDVDAFKAEIRLLNPIEFDVFVNLIQESWDANDNISEIIEDLAKD